MWTQYLGFKVDSWTSSGTQPANRWWSERMVMGPCEDLELESESQRSESDSSLSPAKRDLKRTRFGFRTRALYHCMLLCFIILFTCIFYTVKCINRQVLDDTLIYMLIHCTLFHSDVYFLIIDLINYSFIIQIVPHYFACCSKMLSTSF